MTVPRDAVSRARTALWTRVLLRRAVEPPPQTSLGIGVRRGRCDAR
jgi:hypothetical protein